jgi:glycosyltransferase involved in cell wall biosynthesis
MRVALVWNRDDPHVKATVRYERYMRGFRALGHDPVMVSSPGGAEGFTDALVTTDTRDRFLDPAWWAVLRLDAAVVITWLGLPEVVAAVKAACPWVVAIADSDGQVGVRVHPRATFCQMTAQQRSWGGKLGAAKHWLQLFLGGTEVGARRTLASAEHADCTAVCSPAAVHHLRRFFTAYRRPDLAARVISAPYPIDDCYLAGPVPVDRPARVVAVGRWEDPQKDVSLLCRALERHFAAGARTGVVLFGPNGQRWFGRLAARYPQVRYLGVQSPETIAEYLRSSRVLLLPSRWESGPIVLNEALASGCTVVGTPSVPSVVSACADGRSGTVSADRSPAGLAAALGTELAAWDRQERNPVTLAAGWRRQFDPASVCLQLLAGHPGVVPA